ncbi:MAG TPA: pitrilysin family protein [Acidimicrobiales bacterium]|nr:pitrilysin family protein [Acidimicrobiales bacterium]
MVTERLPGVRSVAVGAWVGIGSRDEAPERSGASHFLEHLLFKGSDDRSAREIAEAVDEVGGDLNAFTTKEYTAFELRLLAEHLDLGLGILDEIVWRPAFRPEEVEAERSVILEEILMSRDEPEDLVHDLFGEALFPGHPVGRSILGDDKTIAAMGRDDIADFHGRHYRPPQVVVAAAGALDHDRVVEAVSASCPSTTGGDPPPRLPPAGGGEARRCITRKTEQAHVILGVRTPGALDDDRFALELVTQALGGGISSRLFQEVRERRGLAYSVYSYRFAVSDCGALAVYAGTAPKNAAQVIDLFHEAFDRLAADGLTERELAIAKGQVKGSTVLGLEDTGARAGRLGRNQLVLGHVAPIDELLDRIDAVRLDDVDRVVQRLGAEPRTLAAIGLRS